MIRHIWIGAFATAQFCVFKEDATMNEIKKLGFGLMRLPQKSAEASDIDLEQVKQMVDRFLERGIHLL